MFSWYVDSKNFTEAVRPLYAKLLAFPIRYFVPAQLRDAAKSRLEKYGVVTLGDLGVLVDKERKVTVYYATRLMKFMLPIIKII